MCNTPGVLDETTADLAFFFMLAASRRATEAEGDLRGDRWPGWGINQYLGHDVHGASLGLVGYGRIGRAVARRATGFGMNVVHHTRTDTGEPGWIGDLHRLLGEVDIVSLHVPLSGTTRHLIGAPELAAMRDSAVLVNTSRGPVVDEAALADALHAGAIFAAGIDVFEREPEIHPGLLDAPRDRAAPAHRLGVGGDADAHGPGRVRGRGRRARRRHPDERRDQPLDRRPQIRRRRPRCRRRWCPTTSSSAPRGRRRPRPRRTTPPAPAPMASGAVGRTRCSRRARA